jgi:hypothetical protein
MYIKNYEYRDTSYSKWYFNIRKLNKVNLLVGDSGTGKTRFMNTLMNIGLSVASKEFHILPGYWNIDFIVSDREYNWQIEIQGNEKENLITKELLTDQTSVNKIEIINRNLNTFSFNGKEIPKLDRNQTSLKLLQEEDVINPMVKGFSRILRRTFALDALIKILEYQTIPVDYLKKRKPYTFDELFSKEFHLNLVLYLLSQDKPTIYTQICNRYKEVFSFITDFTFRDITQIHSNIGFAGRTPVFCIKEKGVSDWIELSQLSSGMQKVLLILTDLHILPEDGIYLIDEYENSLGLSAIDFLPSNLIDDNLKHQLFISSHHPYIINNISMENWFVFHRTGNEVSVLSGEELKERYGKSKQDAFIKLINDPFYTHGVE